MQAPKTDLIRMAEPVALGDEGRTLNGYAAVFNADTVIDSYEGHFVERIAPGAFAKTIQERGDQVKVLFNHGMDYAIGDKPLGKPSVIEEDGHGLRYEVPLDDTSYNRDLIASLRSGAIDGSSFRFSVVKDEWVQPRSKSDLPERTITEAKLYEFGPVTFPAYAAATAGVRSREALRDWVNASDEQRDAIRSILSTRTAEAGQPATSNDEPPATLEDEPVIDHSARFIQLKARARLLFAQ